MVADSLRRANEFFSDVLGRKDWEQLTIDHIGDAIDIRVGGSLMASVPVGTLEPGALDQRRFVELQNRIASKMSIYSTLSSTFWMAPGEQARLAAQLAGRRMDLARDYREFLRLVDRALGVRLSDHFRSRSRERIPGGATENRMAGR